MMNQDDIIIIEKTSHNNNNNYNNTINHDVRIQSLRNLIQEKPRNGRAMAQLAYLLNETEKYNINNDITINNNIDKEQNVEVNGEFGKQNDENYNDPITWAKRSIQIAPHKPYGYIAMSFILPMDRIKERIQYINKALERCTDDAMKFHLFVRLLIEPREDDKRYLLRMKKQQQQQSNRNNNKNDNTHDKNMIHPSTRPFSINEENIYQQMITMYESFITNVLQSDNTFGAINNKNDTINHTMSSNYNNIGTIAYDEYRLGLLFRKMKKENNDKKNDSVNTGSNMYQKRSIYWFKNSIRHFDIVLLFQAQQQQNNSINHSSEKVTTALMINNKSFSYYYSMSQFWLETLTSNNNNNNSNNRSLSEHVHNDDDDHSNRLTTKMITKCPAEYVIGLYSTFAERFDELLVKELQYQTPTILCQLVNECYSQMKIKSNLSNIYNKNQLLTSIALDIGCGTGISGIEFNNHCAFIHDISKQIKQEQISTMNNNNTNSNDNDHNIKCMIGVDLSSHMIEKAKQRKCYNELYIGDATTVLSTLSVSISSDVSSIKLETSDDANSSNDNNHAMKQHSFLYTIVFACDVFVYIGDLNEIIERVYNSLIPGGLFAFSTELLLLNDDNDMKSSSASLPPSYILHSCARFAHSEHYIRTVSIDSGFIILKSKICTIRKNQGKDVLGYLIVLQKP